jgi:hypothetical protein
MIRARKLIGECVATERFNDTIERMTLGNFLQNGARSLD